MGAELKDSVACSKAISHFLGMSEEYAREYVARLPLEPAELLVRALGRLGWWLPEETLLPPERLACWLFRDELIRIEIESGQEVHRLETPQERLSDTISGLVSMASSSEVPRDSCVAMAAFVQNVRLTLKRRELPFGLPIIRAGHSADFRFDTSTLIRFDGECLCQSLKIAGERLNLQPIPINWHPATGDSTQTEDQAFQDVCDLMDRWIDVLQAAVRERDERPSGRVQREGIRSVRRDPEFVEERLQNLKRTWEQEIESLETGWRIVATGHWAGHSRTNADIYLRFRLFTFTTSSQSSPTDTTIAAWHPTILEYLKTLEVDPSPVDDLFRRFMEGDLTDKRAVRREAKRAISQLDSAIENVGQQYEDGEAEIRPSGVATPVLTTADHSQEPEPEFVFRQDGDGYFIRGFGEEGHFSAKGAKGLHHLFQIVQRPGIGVPLLELDAGAGVQRLKGDQQSPQPAADSETFKRLAAKRLQLKANIATAESDLERSELQLEVDKLESTAMAMTGLNGKSRDLNNPLNKLRPKVLGRVETALKRIREQMPNLAGHFGNAVTTESGRLLYSPGSPDWVWVTSQKK